MAARSIIARIAAFGVVLAVLAGPVAGLGVAAAAAFRTPPSEFLRPDNPAACAMESVLRQEDVSFSRIDVPIRSRR